MDGKSDYAGQAVGVIIAESHTLAIKAAQKVKINYGKADPVMIDAREIVDKNVTNRIKQYAKIEPTENKSITYIYKLNNIYNVNF